VERPGDPPARPEDRRGRLLAVLDIESLDDVADRCRDLLRRLALPVDRWSPRILGDVLDAAERRPARISGGRGPHLVLCK
jgi:hypothetical protein